MITFNGINATTGKSLIEPKSVEQIAALAKGGHDPQYILSLLGDIWYFLANPTLGLADQIRGNIKDAGWGVVFSQEVSDDIRQRVKPLIEHRRKLVQTKLKILDHIRLEGCANWLARNKAPAPIVDPDSIPYYLLLVGKPSEDLLEFYHHLSVLYCVGWINFDDPEHFNHYIDSLIRYENGQAISTKKAVFFAPRHDSATDLSSCMLAAKLYDRTKSANYGVATDFYGGQNCQLKATKTALTEILGLSPAFLFTASHGMGWPNGHPNQISSQGALLCQDWYGKTGPVGSENYFAGHDLTGLKMHGLITFHFACFSAGTPQHDRFSHLDNIPAPGIAPSPFFAALPQAFLAKGALACIGHMDRAWGCSIVPTVKPFDEAVDVILTGKPVGLALRDFSETYAFRSTTLASLLEKIANRLKVSDADLTTAWIERNDAEGYLLFGDPAVRLRVNS